MKISVATKRFILIACLLSVCDISAALSQSIDSSALESYQGFKYSLDGRVVFPGEYNDYYVGNVWPGSDNDCGESGQCGPVLSFPTIPIPTTPPGWVVQNFIETPLDFQLSAEGGEVPRLQDCGELSVAAITQQCGPTVPIEE